MKFRRFYSMVATFISMLIISCTPESNQKPNIVYILADDLGYGDVGIYNTETKIETPNIDNLAKQGMRFTDAHSPSSVCTPTRYAILTGRYCWRTRLPKGVLQGYGQALIEDDETTVAELLQKGGYSTGVVGKWHLGLDWQLKEGYQDSLKIYRELPILKNMKSSWVDFALPPKNGPLSHGFDYSYILPASLDMEPYCYLENDVLTELPNAYTPGNDLDAPSWATGAFWRAGLMAPSFDFYEVLPTFIDKAKAFVENHANSQKPFFLYLPLAAPHTPWVPKDNFENTSGAGQYGDFVQMVDAQIGEFLNYLDKLGLSQNTLVIFTSDNGPFWKPEFINRFDHRAAANLRGMKADIWEGGHRIPFIVRWPGIVAENSQTNQLTTLSNLISTVAEITEFPLIEGEGMDSRSILSVLKGGESDNSQPVIHHSSRGFFSIREEDWKYIEGLGSGGFSQPAFIAPVEGMAEGQLYNLGIDLGEQKNVYADNPEKVEEMKRKLDDIRSM